jgi:hypothetical protein
MTRTKSRRRFPSDGCPGPLGDPLVCAPFLDDGMSRVHPNQASSQRIEGAAQHQSRTASVPSPLAGEEGVNPLLAQDTTGLVFSYSQLARIVVESLLR